MDFLQDNDDTESRKTSLLEECELKERNSAIHRLKALPEKVCLLHTNLLYYRNAKSIKGSVCYNAWKAVIKTVGGIRNGWRSLGQHLGIISKDLDYIENYTLQTKSDCCDIVLQMFIEQKNPTLDKIVIAFFKLEWLSGIYYLEEPFTKLYDCFIPSYDSGVCSDSKIKGKEVSYKDYASKLPPVLLRNMVIKDEDKESKLPPILPAPTVQPKDDTVKNKNPMLLMTFTDDGSRAVENIKKYVKTWTEVEGVSIITLNDNRAKVAMNPEKFIRDHFEKADFIVPIVTQSYLAEIKRDFTSLPNTSNNLDSHYVSFIYNIIVNYYISSKCYNFKVRSVIAEHSDVPYIAKQIAMYPDLVPWTYESNFNEQFKAFLKLDGQSFDDW